MYTFSGRDMVVYLLGVYVCRARGSSGATWVCRVVPGGAACPDRGGSGPSFFFAFQEYVVYMVSIHSLSLHLD